MRVIEIAKPNAPFELVERPTPEPGPRQVRIKVEACGICHSDVFAATGAFPGVHYPAVPGHEVAGRIDAIGPDVTTWKVGQRVGVGWFGGACFVCDRCRRGDFITCRNLKVPGIHYDGGYADYMIAPIDALGVDPRRARCHRRGAAALRRHHHLQRAAQCRREAWRCRRHSRHWRARPSRRAVRAPHGLPHRRHRPRQGQGEARARARRASLYRQRDAGRRRRS